MVKFSVIIYICTWTASSHHDPRVTICPHLAPIIQSQAKPYLPILLKHLPPSLQKKKCLPNILFLDSVDLVALAIRLGGPVALVDDEVLGAVVVPAGEVALEDGLCAVGVAALGVERGARHVGDHCVAEAEGVDGGAQRVVGGRGLGEPDVASVAGEVAGAEGLGDVLLDDDGAAGGVDEV